MSVLIVKLRKLLQDRKREVVAILLISIVAIVTAALLPASELSINDSCEVTGPTQKLKSIIQGKRYWVKQLQLLDNEMPYREKSLEFTRAFQNFNNNKENNKEIINDIRKQNEFMAEELYSRFPELRPSPEEKAASKLQRQAAADWEAQFLKEREQTDTKRIRILKLCRPIILAATQ